MKRQKTLTLLLYIILFIIFLLLLLYLIRYFSPRELDDVSPEISCDQNLIDESEILWIIPLFNNESIADNREWCNYILSLNKTLGLHGVSHTYKEFLIERNSDYLNKGVAEFEKCFGFKPIIFKAPQLALLDKNEKMLENEGFGVSGQINQLTHKVYHCSNTGKFSNNFIKRF